MADVMTANVTLGNIEEEKSAPPGTAEIIRQTGRARSSGLDQTGNYPALVNQYISYVYAAANLNARAVAKVPERLYAAISRRDSRPKMTPYREVSRKTKDWFFETKSHIAALRKAVDVVEVTEHPLVSLFEQVNPMDNGYDWQESRMLFLQLIGNSYTYLVLGPNALPVEMWTLMGHHINVIPDEEMGIRGYIYEPVPNHKIRYEANEVVHYKQSSPVNNFYGIGNLQAAWQQARISGLIAGHAISLLEKGAVLDHVLITEGKLDKPRQERAEQMFMRLRTGTGSRRFAVMDKSMELKPIQLSPRETSFMAAKKEAIQEIAAIFGVPMSMLTPEGSNRAVAMAGRRQYAEDTILPFTRRLEQKDTEQLAVRYDERLFFAFNNPVPEDRELIMKEQESNLKNQVQTVNEVRAEQGRDPVEWGDVPFIQSSMIQFGDEPRPVAPMAPARAASVTHAEHKHVKEPASPEQLRAMRPLEAALVTLIREQRNSVVRALFGSKEAKGIAATFSASFNVKEWAKKFDKKTAGIRAEIVADEAMRVVDLNNFEIEFDVSTPAVQRSLQHRQTLWTIEANKKTKESITSVIETGLAAGADTRTIRDAIIDTFDDMSKTRATMMARTETAHATQAASEFAYEQSGVVSGKEWVTAPGACPFCQKMDGKTVDLGDSFFDKGDEMSVGGNTLKHDFDTILHPPLHPSCRCTLAPVLA